MAPSTIKMRTTTMMRTMMTTSDVGVDVDAFVNAVGAATPRPHAAETATD